MENLQLLYNIEIKKKFFSCISKEGVKKTKPVLGKFKNKTLGKMFNIKSKAFLKYLEFLGEEKQEKPVRHSTMRGGGSSGKSLELWGVEVWKFSGTIHKNSTQRRNG